MSLFFILFMAISSLSSVILSLLLGHLTFWISLFSLSVALGGSLFLTRERMGQDWRNLQLQNRYLIFSLILFFILLSFQFTYLLYEIRHQDVWLATLNPNNRGDLPFHINMIKAFARGLSFWPDNLFVIGERLRYPFAMNLFNAQGEILGIPIEKHLMLTGLLCLAILIYELYQWLGIWGLLCFFCSGGFGSYLPNSDLEFKNIYLSVFVTQRGFLWALPAGIWLIRNYKMQSQIWIFILAVMPFFHLHSFVILFLYFLGRHCLEHGFKLPRNLLFAGALASPWILQALLPLQNFGVIHFSTYWWKWQNLGAWGGLCIGTFILMARKKQLRREDFFILALALLFSVLILAPWDWDQIKILVWCYLLLNAVIAETLLKKIAARWMWIIALIVFFPGAVQVWNSLPKNQFAKDRVYLVKTEDVQIIQEKLQNISPNDPVFIAPVYNHPLFFAGQSVVMGYPGHAWSQAVSAKPILDYMDASVQEGRLIEPAPFKKEIKWILSSPLERERWPGSELFSPEDWSLSCVKPGHCP